MDGPSDRVIVTVKGEFPLANGVKKKLLLAETGASTPSSFTFVTSFATIPTPNDWVDGPLVHSNIACWVSSSRGVSHDEKPPPVSGIS